MKRLQLIGKTFGRLYVFADCEPNEKGHSRFWVRCVCKSVFVAVGWRLMIGRTRSCGCIREEVARELGKSSTAHNPITKAATGQWLSDAYDRRFDKRIREREVRKKKYGSSGII